VVVIGAILYSHSSAAYLRAAGIEARVFGEPMAFWENQMPAPLKHHFEDSAFDA
jgi:hypothetical protein